MTTDLSYIAAKRLAYTRRLIAARMAAARIAVAAAQLRQMRATYP